MTSHFDTYAVHDRQVGWPVVASVLLLLRLQVCHVLTALGLRQGARHIQAQALSCCCCRHLLQQPEDEVAGAVGHLLC